MPSTVFEKTRGVLKAADSQVNVMYSARRPKQSSDKEEELEKGSDQEESSDASEETEDGPASSRDRSEGPQSEYSQESAEKDARPSNLDDS